MTTSPRTHRTTHLCLSSVVVIPDRCAHAGQVHVTQPVLDSKLTIVNLVHTQTRTTDPKADLALNPISIPTSICQIAYPRAWKTASPQRAYMVDEQPGSAEWDRIQAKLWCSLPSANIVRVQRVQNQKLWAAFVGPVAEFRDAGGHVRVDLDSSCVREVRL